MSNSKLSLFTPQQLDEKHKALLSPGATFHEVPSGWHKNCDIFMDRLASLQTVYPFEIKIAQMKEKFGGLRLYPDAMDTENHEALVRVIWDLATFYEDEADSICIDCGNSLSNPMLHTCKD